MSDNSKEFSALMARFSTLGSADRRAILAQFSPDERSTFENAVAAGQAAIEAENARQKQADRQFLGYSATIAPIVEGAVKGEEGKLTPAACKAVIAEHQSLVAHHGSEAQGGWQSLFNWLGEIFPAPKPRGEK